MASGCLGLISFPRMPGPRHARAARGALPARDPGAARAPGRRLRARALRARGPLVLGARGRAPARRRRRRGRGPAGAVRPQRRPPRAPHRRLRALPRHRPQQHLLGTSSTRSPRSRSSSARTAGWAARSPTRSSCTRPSCRCPDEMLVGAEAVHARAAPVAGRARPHGLRARGGAGMTAPAPGRRRRARARGGARAAADRDRRLGPDGRQGARDLLRGPARLPREGRAAVDRAVAGVRARPRPARGGARAARLGTGQGGDARDGPAAARGVRDRRLGGRPAVGADRGVRRQPAGLRAGGQDERLPVGDRQGHRGVLEAAGPVRGRGQGAAGVGRRPARRARRARSPAGVHARDADVPHAVRPDRQAAAAARRPAS